MIDDGRAYGVTLALKHILGLLERNGVIKHGDVVGALDNALDELKGLSKGVTTPDAATAAGNAIGLLYIRR
jgi:hypothetical protein